MLHKRLSLHAYKIQLKHEIKPSDRPKRTEFACNMLEKIDSDESVLKRVIFTDEATFHVNVSVNRHKL